MKLPDCTIWFTSMLRSYVTTTAMDDAVKLACVLQIVVACYELVVWNVDLRPYTIHSYESMDLKSHIFISLVCSTCLLIACTDIALHNTSCLTFTDSESPFSYQSNSNFLQLRFYIIATLAHINYRLPLNHTIASASS